MKKNIKNPVRVIGIDPGYARLGVAIVEKHDGQDKLLFSTCLITDKEINFNIRLKNIGAEFESIIKTWQPQILALEKVFWGNNQKTASQISEVRGVLLYLATKNNLNIFEYTPMEIKLTIAGYGKASKNQVIKMTEMLSGLKDKKEHDDEYDAIATGFTCLAREKI